MPTPTASTITLPSGVRLPYVAQGDPDGVPVVLLHGYSDSHRSYSLLLPHLPPELRALALTQRGHGDADRPAAGYGPGDHARDLREVLDVLGIERAVILGHSGGSYAAQRFAVDHPERTLGLVLIGAFRSFGDKPDVVGLGDVVAALTDPVDPAFVREFQESTVSRPLPPGFLDGVVAESLKLPARVWSTWLADNLRADVPVESGPITAPTLILWGDQDLYCPRSDQELLADEIPGARLVVYEGTGHCPHWEEPERAAADLIAFVWQVARPAAREAAAA
jgi:non-heme chloroperoxidase